MNTVLTIGGNFGDYRVVRRLGKGGMGEVWLLKSDSGKQVAAKILDPESSADHESRKRFLREAELALGVKHPNLVETYDVGEDPETGLCYILMEYVSGGTLADYIRENGALAIDDAVAVVEAMADVLELGRQKGIVHRDIKPANIMFDADGTPKLADLGIARAGGVRTDTTTVTQTGVMIGTPAYMSPEQMLDAHNVDTRADIYSLGVVFFEMLTGERPNKDDTIVQLMAKAVKGEPLPDVRTLRSEVSAALAQLLSMMVVPDKNGRISTPGQITNALAIIERGGKFVAASMDQTRRDSASTNVSHTASSAGRAVSMKPPKWLIPVLILAALAGAFFILAPKRSVRQGSDSLSDAIAKTNVILRHVVHTNIVRVQAAERISDVAKNRKSPYVIRQISELDSHLRQQLAQMAACRKSGANRGVMAFGRLKIDGVFSGKGVATYAWLNDDGWFTADIYETAVRSNVVRHAGRRLDFLRHGYQEVDIDLSTECSRKWSDREVLDLGCVELSKLPSDRLCTISLVPNLPSGVRACEVVLRLNNDKPCGYDWSYRSNLQHPGLDVVRRRVASGERVEIADCSPTEYTVRIRAAGCATYERKVHADDPTARNMHTVSLLLVKTARFAIRPFVGGPWQKKDVVVDNEQSLRFHDDQRDGHRSSGSFGTHRLSLNPFDSPNGLLVSSYYQPSVFDDYGELTTEMFDAQMTKGTLANPFSLAAKSGKVNFYPGRIYRFRNSYLPVDVVIAFLEYGENSRDSGISTPSGWLDDLDAAKTQAKREGKQILAAFEGSDWCGWCKKMEKDVYSQPVFLPTVTRRFVPVYIDKPSNRSLLREAVREKNPDLHEEYNVRGVPCVVILDADGKEIGRVGGYKKSVAALMNRIDRIAGVIKEKVNADSMKAPESQLKWLVGEDRPQPVPPVRICFDQSHGGGINENGAFYLSFMSKEKGFVHKPCWYGFDNENLSQVNILVLPPSHNDIPYLPAERTILRTFMEKGGTVFATVDGNDGDMPMSERLLSEYGLSLVRRGIARDDADILKAAGNCPALIDIRNIEYVHSTASEVRSEKDAAAWSALVVDDDGAPLVACRPVGKGHLVYASAGLCFSKEKMRDHAGTCRMWKRLFFSAAKERRISPNAELHVRDVLAAPCKLPVGPITLHYAARWENEVKTIAEYLQKSLVALKQLGIPDMTTEQVNFSNVSLLGAGSMHWYWTGGKRQMIGIRWGNYPKRPGSLIATLVENILNGPLWSPDEIPLRRYLSLLCLSKIGLQSEFDRLMPNARKTDTQDRFCRALEAIRKDCPNFPKAFVEEWAKFPTGTPSPKFFETLSRAIGRDCRPYFKREGIAAFGLGDNAAEQDGWNGKLAFDDREISKMKGLVGDKAAQKAFNRLFPGWKVSGCVGVADEGWNRIGYVPELDGRRNLCCTLPADSRRPVKFKRNFTVFDGEPKLVYSIRKTPYADAGFKLEILIGGKVVSEKRVDNGDWVDESFDLSPWKGKKITLEIRQSKLPDLKHARATWSRLEVK